MKTKLVFPRKRISLSKMQDANDEILTMKAVTGLLQMKYMLITKKQRTPGLVAWRQIQRKEKMTKLARSNAMKAAWAKRKSAISD